MAPKGKTWRLSVKTRARQSAGRKRYANSPEGRAKLIAQLEKARKCIGAHCTPKKRFSQRGRLIYPKLSLGTDWYKEEKRRQIKKQDGVCDLCHKKLPEDLSLCAYDHDHITGECRAVLHRRCNNMISYFEQDIEMLTVVQQYLLRHRPPNEFSYRLC